MYFSAKHHLSELWSRLHMRNVLPTVRPLSALQRNNRPEMSSVWSLIKGTYANLFLIHEPNEYINTARTYDQNS